MTNLDEIRAAAMAAVTPAEAYIPGRYPWTYSADFLRSHTDLIPDEIAYQFGGRDCIVSRSDAAQAKARWAESIDVDEEALAQVFADAYLTEHHIPLGMANTERRAVSDVG